MIRMNRRNSTGQLEGQRMQGPAAEFFVWGTRRLRRLGLAGERIRVRLEAGRLLLSGETSQSVEIPVAEIERIRVGRDDAKYGPFFETRLWRRSGPPIVLHARKGEFEGYGEGVRALAAAVAGLQGLGQVERGLSLLGALFPPLLMLPVMLGAIAVSVLILGDQPWWGRLLVPLAPTLIFVLLIWRCLAIQLPRPVRDLSDLDRQLPR